MDLADASDELRCKLHSEAEQESASSSAGGKA